MDQPTPMASPGDDLLAAARAGDASAFWRLTESYRPYLRGLVARQLGSQLSGKVDASDVVQQGMLTAFQQFGQFRGEGIEQWRHWLLALVRNQTRKIIRHWHQEMRDVQREQALARESGSDLPLAAGSTSPSQQALRRERAARLLAAIHELPPDYREVIFLRNFEDLPYPDIAVRMNRTEKAVRKLWERAVKHLRQQWEENP